MRYFLRESFAFLKRQQWAKDDIDKFTTMISRNVLSPNENRSCDGSFRLSFGFIMAHSIVLGLKLHITDVYLEELAKVAGIALKPKRLIRLLGPFFSILKLSDK